jgi:hypothetical protein
MSAQKSRVMYIERKAESLNGPARIGRVYFSKTGRTVEYNGRKFQKSKSGYKWNHFDVETGDEYWISGPRRDGQDRLYPQSTLPVEIDDDVREEYWRTIRGLPGARSRKNANRG